MTQELPTGGLRIGLLSDPHLGPDTWHAGRLCKVGSQCEALVRSFVRAMNEHFRPHVVLLLGDLLEDTSRPADLRAYRRVFELLAELQAPLLPVAGNHDLIRLSPSDLLTTWREHLPHLQAAPTLTEGHLYYDAPLAGAHLVVLHTHEQTGSHIWFDAPQLRWLQARLQTLQGPVIVAAHHTLADQDTTGNGWFAGGRAKLALVRERASVRAALESSGTVVAVLNGHLHWNNVTWHGSVPYVTLQSLVENVAGEGDACGAWGQALLTPTLLRWEVAGGDPLQIDLPLPWPAPEIC